MSTPNSSPTEEELEAMLSYCENVAFANFTGSQVQRLIHALRSARESARVATRERDEARAKVLVYESDANAAYMAGKSFMRGQLEPQLTDRDRMIAALREHLTEETIGRLRRDFERIVDWIDAPLSGEWLLNAPASVRTALVFARQIARDALAAAPPGEYEQRVRREALEAAAKLADEHECVKGTEFGPVLSKSPLRMRAEIAAAIRAPAKKYS